MASSETYDGPERRVQERRLQSRRSVFWRRVLIGWIILFSLAVMYSLRESRNTADSAQATSVEVKRLGKENQRRIAELERSKAQVVALQATNCGLEVFLLTARKARWDAYQRTGNPADKRAVIGYEQIVRPYVSRQESVGNCPIPARVLIKGRPIVGGH